MARHARTVDARSRAIRLGTLLLVWLGGLAAGLFGLLGAAARYGCRTTDQGLACRAAGSFVGVLLVVVVIAIVTAVTVLTIDSPPKRVLAAGAFGLVGLASCLYAARVLLSSV